MTLRLLTVHQPHAWAIVQGRKTVENRVWRFPLDMPTVIGIHAGVKPDRHGLAVPQHDEPDEHTHGAVVGLVTVFSQHMQDRRQRCGPRCRRWGIEGQWHWMLAQPTPLPQPVPTRGHQGLFHPPDDVLAAVLAQSIPF